MQCMSPDSTGPYLHRRHRYHHRYKYNYHCISTDTVYTPYRVRTSKNTEPWRVSWVGFLVTSPWLAGHCEPGWFVFNPERRHCCNCTEYRVLSYSRVSMKTYVIAQLIFTEVKRKTKTKKQKEKKKKENPDASTRAWCIHSSISVVLNQWLRYRLSTSYMYIHGMSKELLPNTVLIYLLIREYGVLQTIPCIEQVLLLLLRSVI